MRINFKKFIAAFATAAVIAAGAGQAVSAAEPVYEVNYSFTDVNDRYSEAFLIPTMIVWEGTDRLR